MHSLKLAPRQIAACERDRASPFVGFDAWVCVLHKETSGAHGGTPLDPGVGMHGL